MILRVASCRLVSDPKRSSESHSRGYRGTGAMSFLTIVTQRHYCKAAACYYVIRSELSVADLQHG